LDGCPPQEVFVIEVLHGIFVDDVGTRMGVVPLVSMGDGNFMDTVGILGDSRHGKSRRRQRAVGKRLGLLVMEDEQMMSWHPRMPPFIHLSPTRTHHHFSHQSP